MTAWNVLFERAESHEVTIADVREALAAERDNE